MKKKINIRSIVRLTLCSLLLLGTANIPYGCSDGLDLPTPPASDQLAEAGYITLSLTCGNHVTRADEEPGIERYNENRIKSVTLCLSPSAGDRTDADAPAFMQTFNNIDAEGKAILRIPLTMELVTRLFNENNSMSCRIFAAVNVDPGEAKTVEQLRNLVIGSEFATTMIQESFAMDGDGTVEYTPSGNYAIGNVQLKRSAAKITLGLKVDTEVSEVVNGETIKWNPNLEGMRVRLEQGVCTSTLDPTPSVDMDSEVYFNSDDDLMYTFEETDANGEYNRIQSIPLYTYPNKWTDRIDEKHGTFLLLSVPWTSDGGTTYRTCYYHVPIIPFDKFELVRNISYHVNLHVGVLGSFVPEEPFEVECEYYVAEWGTENIEVDIKDYRYLVVDQNDYVVNNENSTSIPFYTSHETVVTDVKMTFYRYNFTDQGSEFAVTISKEQNEASLNKGEAIYTCDFDNKDDILTLSHILNIWVPYNSNNQEVSLTKGLDSTPISGVRDASGRYYVDNSPQSKAALQAVLNTIEYYKKSDEEEYSRIIYEVTVQHKDVADGSSGIDKNLYKETVKITQYPGMYITAYQNYCGNLGASPEWVANGIYGNTIVNGRTDGGRVTVTDSDFSGTTSRRNVRKIVANYQNWDRSIGLGYQAAGYFNWNPNLYLVTITQLSPELGKIYRIGDPRSYNINNDLSNNYGNYTVDGGTTVPFSNEYWYFNNTTSAYLGTGGFKTPQTNVSSYYDVHYILSGFIEAPAIYDGPKRTIKYYYPTRENDDNKYAIAPKFRICSSYAGTNADNTREMSRRRAAAYQEVFFPAGRWRLPTYGEIEYIMTLAAQKKIPRLFGANENDTWYYWCAQGLVQVPAGNAANQNITIITSPGGTAPFNGDNYRARTRFVYDEWYWGNDNISAKPGETPNGTTLMYDFTWGDRPKSNPQD